MADLRTRASRSSCSAGRDEAPRRAVTPRGDDDSQDWIALLCGSGGPRDEALTQRHALLLRATRFELRRRSGQLAHLTAADVDDLATQAADDAMMAVLAKLDSFRGPSRFSTWAYKLALLEAGVKARRRAWQGREISIDEQTWPAFADTGGTAHDRLEEKELLDALSDAIKSSLTPYQRRVFTAVALNGVPIDVLADRLHDARGAVQDVARRPAQAPRRARGRRIPTGRRSRNEVDMSSEAHSPELLTRLLGSPGPEVTCEECFDLLDEYVDLELTGEDADRRLPGMREHLQGCPACREDHDSLRDFVRREHPRPIGPLVRPSGKRSGAEGANERPPLSWEYVRGRLADRGAGLGEGSPLRGRVAIANAQRAYARYRERFSGERWLAIERAGGHRQRPLWASTGTKDPSYSDVLYVERLIAPDVINTMPEVTLRAFADHGEIGAALGADAAPAEQLLRDAAQAGIDLDAITTQLERDGVRSFCDSYHELLARIETVLPSLAATR